MARHEAGETLASIARTYDCSPPAISYIVSRSRARNAAPTPPASSAASLGETQLVKTQAHEVPFAGALERRPPLAPISSASPPLAAAVAPLPRAEAREEPQRVEPRLVAEAALRSRDNPLPRGGNGAAARYAGPHPEAGGAAERVPQNGEARRTLHLSLSTGGAAEPPHHPAAPSLAPSGERYPPRPPAAAPQAPQPAAGNPALRAVSDSPKNREGGAIDHALRERVEADIAAFLSAFDVALEHDTPESRAGLREATDRLLRAGARTRIELERLEARVPLPSRERREPDAAAWRQR